MAFSFTVPAAAGAHTIVATQTGRDGDPVDGTPATAPLQITAASAPSPTATQQGQPQTDQGMQQKQPGSQPHGQPQGPGVSSAAPPPSNAATTVAPPAAAAPPAPGPPVVFSLPAHSTSRLTLTNPPPQVATLWRVDGAVPSAATAATAAAPVAAPPAPAPATSTGSRDAPSVLTLAALAALVASAIVLIATTLQLRSADDLAPQAAPPAPQRQQTQRRSATMRSSDLWSGSPARLR